MEFNLNKKLKGIKNEVKKAAIPVIATLLSTASMAQGGSKSAENDGNKIEHATPTDSTKTTEKNPAKLNDAKEMKSEIKKTAESFKIEFSSYFTTDKAEISNKDAQEISKLISTYVDSLNQNNIDKFLKSSLAINASSDPRPTTTYKNGNLELTNRRAEEVQRIIKESKLLNPNLSQEQNKMVKEKFSNLKFNIPENGVIDYHTVATDAEWKDAKTNEAKRFEIYKKMRFVYFSVVAENNEEKEEVPTTKIETNWNTFKTEGFKKAYVFFDKSPSMEQNKDELKNYILTANEQGIPVRVVGFTDVADTVIEAKNLKEGVEAIKNMKTVAKTKELGIDVIIKEMQEKNDNEKVIALYSSDEEFQDLTKQKLEEMTKIAKEKNVEFIFYVKINGKKDILSLNDLKTAFNQQWEKMGRDIDIQNTKQGIINFNNDLAKTTDEKEKGEIKKMIAMFENRLKNYEKINVEDFTKLKKIGLDYTKVPNTTSFNSGTNDITKNK